MQKRQMNKKIILASIFSLGIILISMSFLSAGFWDIFTGKASSSNATVSLSNTPPVVYWVSSIPDVTLNPGTFTSVTFYFAANDSDGIDDLDNSSASGAFNYTGETTRSNSSCAVVGAISSVAVNYTCTVDFWYWDKAATWTVNASISDLSGGSDSNTSTSVVVNQLTSFTLSPTGLTWLNQPITVTNASADNDPVLVNNTGNYVTGTGVQINASDLVGVSNSAYWINAENFTAANVSTATSNHLANNTNVTALNAVLGRGNNSLNYLNSTSGQEQVYFYLEAMNQNLIQQTYSTTAGAHEWIFSLL